MITLPPALLIDLDDTILDTTPSADRNWLNTAQRARDAGIPIDPTHFTQHMDDVRDWFWSDPQRSLIGRLNLEQARADMITETLVRMEYPNDIPTLAEQLQKDFTANRIPVMQPLDGAMTALAEFKNRNIKTALLTNGMAATQRAKVIHFELEQYFDKIYIEGEIGIGKPEPKLFHRVLSELDVTPDQAWMIGDSLAWEVAAPQQLGIKGVWLDWRRQGLPAESDIIPDLIIHSLADLI
ncbi:Pyrimidine 5'-nucleotidase YjjG [Poriferisphaera corsica]|uniref:Pyrimidine 5'-nucleotidase YjjG n=1 Tax=Poriferisphaera corsica TaxID=2528020 RepID=A0A517YYA1_9BACT|nr:HAD family hydrolase [Poriferisphaera corsica]QDU35189.1 Pyrimidine 5'-nucleotidase YjjG [Poriferisphaera corsica]